MLPAALRVLIVGSFPSEASLAQGAYYAHPRNHFWPLLAACGVVADAHSPYAERVAAAAERCIGLWDLYRSVERRGSGDAAIREAIPNDLPSLWRRRQPFTVLLNGKRRREWRRHFGALPVEPVALPSTSPRAFHWNTPTAAAATMAEWREALAAGGVAVSAASL